MSRRAGMVAAGLFAAFAAACDSSPTAPSLPATEPPSFSLAAGNYTLTITVGLLPPLLPIPGACLETTSDADRAAIPVMVSIEDQNTRRIRPVAEADQGMVISLAPTSRNVLTGPIEGSARDPSTGVVASVVNAQTTPVFVLPAPSVFGTLTSASTISGYVNAQVRFTSGGGSRMCFVNTWRLDPR